MFFFDTFMMNILLTFSLLVALPIFHCNKAESIFLDSAIFLLYADLVVYEHLVLAWNISGNTGASILSQVIPYSDRKSTRLNSSHITISYAVFCLKKKNVNTTGYIDH